MNAKPDFSRGLTLIEIVVVVLIVGVLAVAVTPIFTSPVSQNVRHEANEFVLTLQAAQERSLNQIKLLALQIQQDRSGYSVWEYSGNAKSGSHLRPANERFSATSNFNFSLESQIESSDSIDKAQYWKPLKSQSNASNEIASNVELKIVAIKQPVRQDYKDEQKFENKLILIESGIITTPFEVHFTQADVTFFVKLDQYGRVIMDEIGVNTY